MGNGVINCCEASSSMMEEITMLSPRSMKSPHKVNIINEVCQTNDNISNESQSIVNRITNKTNLQSSIQLHIKVVNSGPIPKDTHFKITNYGLENSKRTFKDGKVYFGCKRKDRNIIINDIVIPVQNKEIQEHHRGRHFCIYYSIEKDSFCIRDLGKGFGAYVRLDSSLILKENMIINIGSSFLAFSQAVLEKIPVLNIKIMGEERGSICFEGNEYVNKHITMGRGITCDLRLDDNLLSKIHATVFYNSNGWNLVDGDMQKKSTNGTWLYLSEEIEMYTSMIFKANQAVFQVVSVTDSS
ncbi:hypothetical protein SteCoe_3295 [Stentor coeruleus]|uniref:FHA domain-containing protein n=1 Tax=Stentor coeruleus TaxID=5963 RepID=A0A1R2CXJ3_9CILI|nr:hypothetical protein SteCoe_3295 [Stentor coeruleus]